MEIKKHIEAFESEPMPITKNAVHCLICDDVLESNSRHDFHICSCGNVAIDGGHEYIRRIYVFKDKYEELSQFKQTP